MNKKNFRFSWLQATALVGLLGITGCQEPEVMNKRSYVPPAERDPNFISQPEENFPVDQADKKSGKKHIDAVFALPPMEDMSTTPISGPDHSAAQEKAVTGGTYTVVSGDSLGKIAYRNKISVSKLAAANNIAPTAMIRIGQKLVIPGTSGVVAPEPKSTKVKSADKPAADKTVAATPGAEGLHTVKSGDSISRIAQKYKVKRADLLAANKLNENSVLRIGQKLVIPGATVSASATKTGSGSAVKTTTNTTDNVDAQLDALANELKGTEAPAVGSAAPVAPAQVEAVSGQPVEISADITVDAFAKQYNVSVEDLKKANQIPADNVLKAQTVVFLP